MKYMILIQHGPQEWDDLSEDERKQVAGDYQAVSTTPRSSSRRGFRRRGSAEPSRCGR
jgi:hypothetical protein